MMPTVLAFVGPPDGFGENHIGPEIFDTPCIIGGGEYCINRASILMLFAALIVVTLFLVAFRSPELVPRGLQNIMESVVEFVRNGIALEVMGPDGLPFVPFLTALFSFIFISNLFEVMPLIHFPPTSRIALPLFLAVAVWIVFNVVGVVKQGTGQYFKSVLFPPGVPVALYVLVTPIEFVSTFIVRPFSLAVRLFGNMFAGHLILTIFALGTVYLLAQASTAIFGLPSFVLMIFLTAFELLVAGLQAYIFTILTAVYIGGAMHPEH